MCRAHPDVQEEMSKIANRTGSIRLFQHRAAELQNEGYSDEEVLWLLDLTTRITVRMREEANRSKEQRLRRLRNQLSAMDEQQQ